MSEKVRCNRRTLKKRFRSILFLCVFITLVLYSAIVIYTTAGVLQTEAGMISNYFSTYIAHNMNSESFLKQMGINGLSELSSDSNEFQDWIYNIRINGNISNIDMIKSAISKSMKSLPMIILENNDVQTSHVMDKLPVKDDFYGAEDILQIKIMVGVREIYADPEYKNGYNPRIFGKPRNSNEGIHEDMALEHVLDFFNTESICGIKDENGLNIATVSVKLDYGTILGFIAFFVGGFVLTFLLAIVAGLFISKLLTYPVVMPLSKLQEKFNVIASGDIESTINSHIVMKRPLKEIESLVESTNSIMYKVKEYSDILTA